MGTERLFRLSPISFCFLFYLSCCLRFFFRFHDLHATLDSRCTHKHKLIDMHSYGTTLKNDSSAYINIGCMPLLDRRRLFFWRSHA
jgi:hypothetical protein